MRKTLLSIFVLGLLALAHGAERVDLIVSGARVVTMDAARHVIGNGAVAIARGRIVAVGPRAEIDRNYTSKTRIDRPNALLTPGLVNTHAHAPMSILRGIADDKALDDWLRNYIFPAEAKNVNPEFVLWGTRLAVLEMLLSGTTTYTDMYYFEDVVAQATKDAGMRGVLGETVIGFPAPDFKTPQETLAYAEKFIQHWKGDALITPAVAPHAVYTNSAETLRASTKLADRYGVPLIIHVSETKKENDDIERQYKRSPTRFLYENGGFAHRTLFAHGIWISPEDRALMIEHGVAIAHCPSSNLKLASGILPAADALKQGVTVGLGTDGPAGSNNDFNMFEEMDLAAKIAKVSTMDPRVLPAETVFAMATIQGARALQMDKEIGSLEPDKRADLITVSMDEPNGVPRHDPYSMLVYTLKGADVRDVVVEGRVLVRDRQALTLNRAEIFRHAEELRRRVEASLKVTRP